MSSYNTARNVVPANEYDAVRGKKSEEKTQHHTKKDVGTIFMGPETNREMSIDDILGQSSHSLWNKNTEEEYMTRLKEKAILKVKSLLARAEEKSQERLQEAEKDVEEIYARAKAKEEEAQRILDEAQNIKAEAENIKENATEQGYTQGLHQAQSQLEQAREEIVHEKSKQAKACSHILLNIHEQCITIFDSWRKDLTELLLEAVEKSTGYILDNEKTALLQALLSQSVNALLDKREYKVRVNPSEAMLLTSLMEEVNKSFGQNSHWTLESDDSLETGSIVVESPSGLIRNERQDRESLVQEVLDKLNLPLGEGDQKAYDAITRNLVGQAREAKIPLSPEEEENYAQQTREELQAMPDLIEKESAPQQNPLHETPEEIPEEVQEEMPISAQAEVVEEAVEDLVEPEVSEKTEKISNTNEENLASSENISDNAQEIVAQTDTISEEASKLVEEELSQLDIDSKEDLQNLAQPQEENQAKTQAKTEEKNGYTTELADELLNEMGFN